MSFDGQVLKRGFWLYIWKIYTLKSNKEYLYVGRTGDSSSPNAASPFNHIGRHLDFRKNAKGNSLAKNLLREEIEPQDYNFEMVAIDPIFSEQNTMKEHIPIRDIVAALEFALSEELKRRNYIVLGTYGSRKSLDEQLFDKVLEIINNDFPFK